MLYIICAILVLLLVNVIKYFIYKKIEGILPQFLIGCVIISVSYGIIEYIDFHTKTDCKEVWSGYISNVEHREEWDEWHEGYWETETYTDSNGNTQTREIWHEGYWEHHNAENYIMTTDNGTELLYNTPDGRKLTDSFVNSTKELEQYYPINTPTASIHTYTNKVKNSYSIYKNKEVDENDYPNLPDYPMYESNYKISRLVGDFGDDSDKFNDRLNKINSRLNDTNNPNNEENKKSYKQVNIIFVNMGNVDIDYGYALQNKWENGNKNDFIISFGIDETSNITWCYPITWCENEELKYDIRKYMEDNKNIEDFDLVLEDTSNIIEDKFERKQFADFDYIQVPLSIISKVIMIIILLILCIMSFIMEF